ncbi:PRP38 pre-mRNA processing factor 38 domain-containing protein B [Mortierella hygrophila]|uniref:Pre-mRNA-splicing factor 38 n=1 Tax=Mortierella hygrophila TaxID=979708 RepID=A0A9P6FCQ9_9FUNG|nr:PRP38 pre-mRNA processing factor 38 domain-containing protein B [Mortierella hygrophila]
MSNNILATHGNERTMNLNSVIFQNIIDSPYLKTIAELETFHEVQTEAQRNEPFLKGTTPSTAWVLMYKFWTLRLTVRQIEGLIDNAHSVYLRGLGFLYLRFVCKPDQLWDWMGDYLEDDQEITLQAGPKPVYSTIGKMCYMLLHDQKFQGQMLPRIPVLVMRDLEQKLEPFADVGRAKAGQRDHFKKDRDNRGRDGGRGRERDRDSSSSRHDRRRSRSRSRSRGRGRTGRRYDDDDREGIRSRRHNDSRSRSRSRDRWGDRRREAYRRRSRSRSRSRGRDRSRSPGRR